MNMDPLTITATVMKVTATCLQTAKALYELHTLYKDAPMYIISISSETTVINASLSKLQSHILGIPDMSSLVQARPELAAALDTALAGCMVLFSCLDDELNRIMLNSSQSKGITWKGKARSIWNRDKLKDLLDGLRGLQISLNLLLQLLQVDSLEEIKRLIQRGRPALATTAQTTETLISSHPEIANTVPGYSKDIFGIEGSRPEYAASIWSKSDFDFEDLQKIARRRALYAAQEGSSNSINEATPVEQEGFNKSSASKNPTQKHSSSSSQGIEESGGQTAIGSVCARCQQPIDLSLQFIPLSEHVFHVDCFVCNKCGTYIGDNYFEVPDTGPKPRIYCETCYPDDLDLCRRCGEQIDGPHITMFDQKYHPEHFNCAACSLVFGHGELCYEFDGDAYCSDHNQPGFGNT